jgi:hypothetical protein
VTAAFRLRTTVPVVPDAAIGHFSLTIFGGSQGYLVNSRSICKKAPVVRVDYAAQNERAFSQRVKTKTACSVKKKKKSAKRVR